MNSELINLFKSFIENHYNLIEGGGKSSKKLSKKSSKKEEPDDKISSKKLSKKSSKKEEPNDKISLKKDKKKSSKKDEMNDKKRSKRNVSANFLQYQRLVSHLRKTLQHSQMLLRLASIIKDDVAKDNPNLSYEEIINKSIEQFDNNKEKYKILYKKLKEDKDKKKSI